MFFPLLALLKDLVFLFWTWQTSSSKIQLQGYHHSEVFPYVASCPPSPDLGGCLHLCCLGFVPRAFSLLCVFPWWSRPLVCLQSSPLCRWCLSDDHSECKRQENPRKAHAQGRKETESNGLNIDLFTFLMAPGQLGFHYCLCQFSNHVYSISFIVSSFAFEMHK